MGHLIRLGDVKDPARRGLLAGAASLLAASSADALTPARLAVILGVRPWDPRIDMPVALRGGLWDAAEPSTLTLNGAGVAAWSDRWWGYSLTQSTGSAQMAYSATSFNGLAGLTADGVGTFVRLLNIGTAAPTLPTGTNESWGFALERQDAPVGDITARYAVEYGQQLTAAGRAIGRQVVNATNTPIAASINSNFAVAPGDASGYGLISGNFATSGANVMVARLNGVNGAPLVPTTPINTLQGNITVGANLQPGGNNPWNGGIARVLWISGALTGAQLDIIEAWLVWRYGLQSLLPNNPYVRGGRRPMALDGLRAFGSCAEIDLVRRIAAPRDLERVLRAVEGVTPLAHFRRAA